MFGALVVDSGAVNNEYGSRASFSVFALDFFFIVLHWPLISRGHTINIESFTQTVLNNNNSGGKKLRLKDLEYLIQAWS